LSKKPIKQNGAGAGGAGAGASKGSSDESPMDVSLLERLVRLMSVNDLNTIDVRDGDKRVILKRGAAVAPMMMTSAPAVTHAHAPAASGAASQPPAPTAESEDAKLTPIKSPMVGTFYAAPSPDAKAFVSVGSKVDEETDVCVIEAMKVFNNIKAECRGTIAKILVTNGQTVEFGQPLFLVKP
jgi:acetyl-CoA carboxylase biotin carboxyl carrier protein